MRLDDARHARLLRLHRALIALRRATPELTDPRFAHTQAASHGPAPEQAPTRFRMDRGAGLDDPSAGIVSVCIAFGEPAMFAMTPADGHGERSARILLATTPDARFEHPDGPSDPVLTMPAWSAAVIRLR